MDGSPDPRLPLVIEGLVQLAAGDLHVRLQPDGSRDEIDAVIVGINLLADELQFIYEDLENRVEQRTAELQAAQIELQHMALTDALTGLANRSLLMERAQDALTAAAAGHTPPALLLLDLDSFKAINDTLGHGVGDEVLTEVARRLTSAVRNSDLVARLGGDEFAILLPSATPEEALRIAERILEQLRVEIVQGNAVVWAQGSIGISYAAPDATAASLLRDADIAMYAAKQQGRNNVQQFRAEMLESTLQRSNLAAELRGAISSGELSLQYQPVVELNTGQVTGFEALVRWHHPTRGAVPPAEFVTVAEANGLVGDLGRWVLRAAAAQLRSWRQEGLDVVPVHVNVSASELLNPGLPEEVADLLHGFKVEPDLLVFEITETVLMNPRGSEAQVIDRLRTLGVRLHIDDFGTGYSSISYLQHLPADMVKIDGSLIVGIEADRRQQDFIAAVLRLISAAGLEAIAEGIESPGQADRLRKLGCSYGQGFHLGRPQSPEGVAEILRARR